MIDRFKNLYCTLNTENIHLLDEIYDRNIRFTDPFHTVVGIDNLRRYFRNMYENVTLCEFDFEECAADGEHAFLSWTMRVQHPRLNRGNQLAVPGATLINFSETITVHRDYFDAGKLIYENVPVIASAIRLIKRRMQIAS